MTQLPTPGQNSGQWGIMLNDFLQVAHNADGTAKNPLGFNVKGYGATGDGVTDDTVAIQNAVTAAGGGMLVFPPGTYLLSAEVTIPSNLTIMGSGAVLTSAVRFRSYFGVLNCSNVSIFGMRFDLAKSVLEPLLGVYADLLRTSYNVGVYASQASNLTIDGCVFMNLYTVSIELYACSGRLTITNCSFSSPAQTQNQKLDHIVLQTCSAHIQITHNDFDNAAPATTASGVCGIVAEGTQGLLLIEENRFNYCGRDNTGTHRLGVVDFYGNSTDIRVVGNVSTNGMAQFMRLAAVARVKVLGNVISTASNAEVGTQMISVESTIRYVGSGQVGAQDVEIAGNTFTADSSDTTRIAIVVGAYDYSVPSTDINIHDNVFHNMKYAVYAFGPLNGVSIRYNSIRGNTGYISVLSAGGGLAVTSLNGVAEAQSVYANLAVTDNVFNVVSAANVCIGIDLLKVPEYTGSVQGMDISRNTIVSTSTGLAGILVRSTSATATEQITLRGNRITNYSYGFYILACNDVTMENNRTSAIGVSPILQSGNGAFNTAMNRWSGGAYSGRIQLAAGSATVSTLEVVAGDNIALSRVVASGSPQGALSLGTIVPVTSFVILSDNAADTSVIFWQIIH